MPKRRRFIQSRLADLREGEPSLLPAPRSTLLSDPGGEIHTIDVDVVSELGLRVESRYVLARGTDGRPHLWLRRRRLPRPAGGGNRLAFDTLTPDHRTVARSTTPAVRLEMAVDGPHDVANGVARVTATVRASNEDTRILDRIVVYLLADRGGFIAPPLHRPVELGPVEPTTTQTVVLEAKLLHCHSEPVTGKLRALVFEPDNGQGIPRLVSADITVGAGPLARELRIEQSGPPRDEGAVRHLPLIIQADRPTDWSAVQLDVRSQDGVRWSPVGGFTPDSPGGAPAASISGVASFNLRQVAAPIELRALVVSPDLADVRVSEPALVSAPSSTAASPVLSAKLALRDARRRPPFVEVLAIVTLVNTGDADVEDVELSFEQLLGAGDSWAWQTVEHAQRSPRVAIGADRTAAVPVVLRLHAVGPPLVTVRLHVRSRSWAIAERSSLTEPLPTRS